MATTYLHPQAQKYVIAMRNNSYNMRSKDLICIHGASLIIYGLAYPGGASAVATLEDISSKLSVFYPVIGTTQTSLSLDFIRLISGVWTGSPAATAGDGYVDFSTNTPTRMQAVKTGFTPPANQTNYHLAYYSATASVPSFPIQVDVGSSNGIGLSLGMKSTSGALGNLYNTTNAFCLMLNPSNGNPVPLTNAFVVSRLTNTQEHFYYSIDDAAVFNPDESSSSPISSNATAFAPGSIIIGADLAAPGVTYTTKNCEGVSAGSGLTKNQAQLLLSAFYYIHTNK